MRHPVSLQLKRMPLRLGLRAGDEVLCLTGTVWITHDLESVPGGHADVVLDPDETFVAARAGRYFLAGVADGPTSCRVTAGAPRLKFAAHIPKPLARLLARVLVRVLVRAG